MFLKSFCINGIEKSEILKKNKTYMNTKYIYNQNKETCSESVKY